MDLINVLYPPLIPSPPSSVQLLQVKDNASAHDDMNAPSINLQAVCTDTPPPTVSAADASSVLEPNTVDRIMNLPAELRDMIYDLLIGPVIHPFRPRALQPKPNNPSTALPLLCVSSAWNDDVLQFIMRTRRIEFEGLASFARFLHRSSQVWIGQAPAVLLKKAVVVCDASDFGKMFEISELHSNFTREKLAWRGLDPWVFCNQLSDLQLEILTLYVEERDVESMMKFDVLNMLEDVSVGRLDQGQDPLTVWTHGYIGRAFGWFPLRCVMPAESTRSSPSAGKR